MSKTKDSFFFVFCLLTMTLALVALWFSINTHLTGRIGDINDSDLVSVSEVYGFSSESDGNGSSSTIVFRNGDYTVTLAIIAETPDYLTVQLHPNDDPIAAYGYNGAAISHQFSNEAIKCYWHDVRVYMTPEEYDDFVEALKGVH